MKNVFILLMNCFYFLAIGQQEEIKEDSIFENAYYLFSHTDEMPLFGTCDLDSLSNKEQKECSDRELLKFFAKNFKYPNAGCFAGKLIIQWTIDAEGCVINFKDVRPLHEAFTKAALDVVNKMPRWIPRTRNGKPVEVRYTFPLNVDIQGGKYNLNKNLKLGSFSTTGKGGF
jgi:hypothetical protein